MKDTALCMKCGTVEHLNLLDGKNPSDENGDFTQIECIACYGPGWLPTSGPEDFKLSVAPALVAQYAAYLARAGWRLQ
jgi:hypothetical protein